MEVSDTYFTIATNSQGLFKEKGSKFIAYAFPLKKEDEVKGILNRLRKEHPQARHFCYAWRLFAPAEKYRYSDDGEPSGTAGKPIYGQLLSKELHHVLIVVVRYFGGTLLGTGGLIQAYKQAAAESIQQAEIIEQHVMVNYKVSFDFENMNEVMKILKEHHCKINSQDFKERMFIHFTVKKSLTSKVGAQLQELQKVDLKNIPETE